MPKTDEEWVGSVIRMLIEVYGPELVCRMTKRKLMEADTDLYTSKKYELTQEEQEALEEGLAAQMDDLKSREVWDLMYGHLFSWELKEIAKEQVEEMKEWRNEGGPC